MKSFISLALLGAAVATPVVKRASQYTDIQILNYALTLEHLEATFYAQYLAQYSKEDFEAAGFSCEAYDNLKEIAYDEKTHVSFLTSAISAAGGTPVPECSYNFGVNSVQSFLATASILEGVGVSAYLGAAADINTAAYLTAAGSILTVEARHNAYIRSQLSQSPFPQAFDAPLDFNEVYTLAGPFITGCPQSAAEQLPLKAFPALAVTSKDEIRSGSTITVSSKATGTGTVYAAFVTVTGPVWAEVSAGSSGSYHVTVPAGVHGQSYLVFTSSKDKVADENTVAGPAVVEISGSDGSP